jgi:hypothetical protein
VFADDDEVGVELLCGVDDLLGGVAEAYLGVHLHAELGRFGGDLVAEPRICWSSTWISSSTSPTVAP